MKQNVGFIGAGNLCQMILEGWMKNQLILPSQVFISNRTPGKLSKLTEQWGVQACATNEEVVDRSDVVILATKPQDLMAAIEPLHSAFRPEQIVISLAAGIPLSRLKKALPNSVHLARMMANTPAKVMRGAFGYCCLNSGLLVELFVERMFSKLGTVIKLEEGDEFEAFSVATSAGVGFVFELMIYWQEWLEERGIDSVQAAKLTMQTFAGAAELARESGTLTIEELQSKVTSKKGITAAGLQSMRELEIERALRISFEKAAIRDRELAQE